MRHKKEEFNKSILRFEKKYLILLFLISFFISIALSYIGWNNNLLDFHGFRQTQTAISTYYMIKDGISINYVTPILGPPWSIPMEFPTFQIAVASAVKLFHFPLDQTGRFFSLLFFYLSLIPLFLLLNLFVKNKSHCFLILSFVLLNPIYIFWSRTFMIESTALFFSIGLLYFATKFLYLKDEKKYKYIVYANIFGILAGVTKITTLTVFLVFLFLIVLDEIIADLKANIKKLTIIKKYVIFCFWTYFLPAIFSIAWVKYSDFIKLKNPLAGGFITSQGLTSWNFGTLSQKLSLDTWDQIFNFSVLIPKLTHIYNLKSCLFILLVFLLVILILENKYRKWFFGLIIIYLSGPLIFTNLYYVHTYYQYANSIFLSLAIGFFCLSLLNSEKLKNKKIIVFLLIPTILGLMLSGYFGNYYKNQKKGGGKYDFINLVKNKTNTDGVLLIYGFGWSSVIPYYSERKVIFTDYFDKEQKLDLSNEKIQKSFSNLGNSKIEAFIVNKSSPLYKNIDSNIINQIVAKFNLKKEPIEDSPNVLIYIKK